MSTPGTSSRSSWRILSIVSSRWRPLSGFMLRMYSPAFTGAACSSISARPVLLTKYKISPLGFPSDFCIARNLLSIKPLVLLDASREEPGGSVTLTRMLPSSNCGRKFLPSCASCQAATPTILQVRMRSKTGRAMLNRIRWLATFFSPRSKKLS